MLLKVIIAENKMGILENNDNNKKSLGEALV